MIKISRLYSEPSLFDPIDFSNGVNLIIGETDELSEKTNGVGKTLSVEFINYCLLKKFGDSRVSRIPEDAFPYDALICLDFTLSENRITSKRSIRNHESPTLIINGETTNYFNITDASSYLTTLMFGSSESDQHPSFRGMLGPLIRDERSEFKSIIRCYDTSSMIPPDYTPYLYLFGINPALYKDAKKLQVAIDNTVKARAKLKGDIQHFAGKNISGAKADLNDLNGQVDRVKAEMDNLENTESFEIVKDEIVDLETALDLERTKASIVNSELSKIKLFKGDNYIAEGEVVALYERFKAGLGDAIQREIQEVTAFKNRIDSFQRTLLETKRASLLDELNSIRQRIKSLDNRYKDKLLLIDQGGGLKNLKLTVATYQKKLEERSQLSAFIKKYDEYDSYIKRTRQERNSLVLLLEALVKNSSKITKAFEQTILDLHESIMGNRRSFFEIKVSNNKEIVDFELRIDDDGSHSNEREKVFFYDMAMLLTDEISPRHPGLLIHDNIFDVDQDTLVKSLNYLANKAEALEEKQYILTINRDKFSDGDMSLLQLDLPRHTRASFTKEEKFLKVSYQET